MAIYTPESSPCPKKVTVNGREIPKAFMADTRRGIVDAYREPLKLDKWRKRALTMRYRGRVEVHF